MITEAMVEAACRAYDDTPPGTHERAMRSALEAAERASWQPIETVPKHQVVLAINGMSQTRSTIYYDGGRGNEGKPKYTHWRPLPEPPGLAGENET